MKAFMMIYASSRRARLTPTQPRCAGCERRTCLLLSCSLALSSCSEDPAGSDKAASDEMQAPAPTSMASSANEAAEDTAPSGTAGPTSTTDDNTSGDYVESSEDATGTTAPTTSNDTSEMMDTAADDEASSPDAETTSDDDDTTQPTSTSDEPVQDEAVDGDPSDPEARATDVALVDGVEVSVHEQVSTILVVTWNQLMESEEVWLEFNFEEGDVMRSRAVAGTTGSHRDVVLGVPGDTDVEIRIVNLIDGARVASDAYSGRTDPVPAGMPLPDVLGYDPERSTPERWMLASVENSTGNLPADYLLNTFWVYIMDRQGRIVWYYADPASNATMSFQRLAKDGEYIWIEKRPFSQANNRSVVKMSLDWEYFEEVPVDGLADCIDVTPDGSLLYDANDQLREMDADGNVRTIFDCREHFGGGFSCYSNTINHSAQDDTVLMSYPEPNTVIQVSRSDGEVVGQYGAASGSWSFAPPQSSPPDQWGFGFQHFPNITADGTLLVSTHLPGFEGFQTTPGEYQHAFVEFEIDRDNEQLVEVWRYTDAPEWPRSRGMVVKLDNGNYLGNYGTNGVIREITPDGETVFHVKFDHDGENDFFNKLVGNNEYIEDLYALNGGPDTGPSQ